MECVDRKMTEPVKFRDNQLQGLLWSQVRTILALFHVWRLEVEQEKGKSLSARISQFQDKVPGLCCYTHYFAGVHRSLGGS